MNELALFAGSGGGILGSKLLGHRMIGYVEINEYCQKVIKQRINDGIIDEAPIFSDIKAFNREGYAEAYQGMVDIVSGGFPCQDISCAGKGEGITGKQSGLWFEMENTIRLVRPRYVFIENVPTLLIRGFEHVLSGLSKMGYDAAWGIISAANVGAPHLRKRIWFLANAATHDDGCSNTEQGKRPVQQLGVSFSTENVANSVFGQWDRWGKRIGWWEREPLKALQDAREGRRKKTWVSIAESELGRVAHGVANRVDRLKAIGNGQVPLVAATAFRILYGKVT